jgi:hypothetical protein
VSSSVPASAAATTRGGSLAVLACALIVGATGAGLAAEAGTRVPQLLVAGVGLSALVALAFAGRWGRAAAVAGSGAYVAILLWAYQEAIAPTYGYQGLIDRAPSAAAVTMAVVLAVLPSLWLPVAHRRPSAVVAWFLYVLGYVPAIAVPTFIARQPETTTLLTSLAMLGSMACIGVAAAIRVPNLRRPTPSAATYVAGIVVFAIAVDVYLLATFGLSFDLPDLGEVYDVRSAFRGAVGGGVGAIAAGYLIPWAGNAINPMLMTVGIVRRQWWLVGLGLVGQLLIYQVTGFKSILFSVVLVPAVLAMLAIGRRAAGPLVAVGAGIVLWASVVATTLIVSPWPLALASRLFATPGQVAHQYFDWFATHPTYGLAHSVLRGITATPWTEDPPFVIGTAYFSSGTNANGIIWADGFANFGLGGVLAVGVVLALALWIVDIAARGRDLRLTAPVFAIAGLSLANGAVLTTLLTLGMGLAIVLVALLPSERAAHAPDGTVPTLSGVDP